MTGGINQAVDAAKPRVARGRNCMAVLDLGQVGADKLGGGTLHFDSRFDVCAGISVTTTNN